VKDGFADKEGHSGNDTYPCAFLVLLTLHLWSGTLILELYFRFDSDIIFFPLFLWKKGIKSSSYFLHLNSKAVEIKHDFCIEMFSSTHLDHCP